MCTGFSDEHDAEHGARSGREQLPVRSEATKSGSVISLESEENAGQ